MSAFEGDQLFFTDQNMANEIPKRVGPLTQTEALEKFTRFLKEFSLESKNIYRDQLVANCSLRRYTVVVDMSDLLNHDIQLGEIIREHPLDYIPTFEQAAKELYVQLNLFTDPNDLPDFQIQIISNENSRPLRDLRSSHLHKLINITGIVISANKPQIKSKVLICECRNCHDRLRIPVDLGISSISIPKSCERNKTISSSGKEKCPQDPYVVVPDKCEFMDIQILKLQEIFSEIPAGDVPRTVQIYLDRYLVDRLIPGSQVTFTGVQTLLEKKTIKSIAGGSSNLRLPYFHVLGFSSEKSGVRKMEQGFTKDEKERFEKYSRDPLIYQRISKSIGSAIYGADDIKKAIACQLFSGSRKELPDKTKLRGDINILLIGDPSTAKSQFLKFVERIAPISVFTTGKGSSAAGLTASILRDPATREFHLEGGAMVLADGGIVCIDEFDKMRPQDRVAIHEAMEQQTISVAKAGINTVLNSRTSVIAAANPIFGRYDDLKQVSEQIDLQTTILSRFDCIFIVRDVRTEEHDQKIAKHIIGLHTGEKEQDTSMIDLNLNELKKYIAYAKTHVSPRLSEEAGRALQNMYLEDRMRVKNSRETKGNHIPITVRQLEAIIRLSEALAKMILSPVVTAEHVEEAHRLFQVSTMSAIKAGMDVGIGIPANLTDIVSQVEAAIKAKIPIGGRVNYFDFIDTLSKRFSNPRAIELAVRGLVLKDEFKEVNNGKQLLRNK